MLNNDVIVSDMLQNNKEDLEANLQNDRDPDAKKPKIIELVSIHKQ